jgi:O-antigen/teichoic acid export membrane protein
MTLSADEQRETEKTSAEDSRTDGATFSKPRVPMFRKLLALLSDAAVYGASSVIGQLIGLLLVPVLTFHLGPEDMGIVFMLGMLPRFFAPLANLGMTNAIFRRFNQFKDEADRRQILSTGLLTVLVSTIFLTAVALLFSPAISEQLLSGQTHVGLVQISIVSAALASLGAVPRVILRAKRQVKIAAALNVLNVAVYSSVLVIALAVLKLGVSGVIIGTLIADLLTLAVAIFCTRTSFQFVFSLTWWKGMMTYGLPFVPHYLQAAVLELFGLYMVRQMLGLAEAGLFGVAARFATPVAFVVSAVQTSWVAHKFQVHAEDEDSASFFRSMFSYYCAGMFYLWLGVAIWGPELLRLVTPAKYDSASMLIPFLAMVPLTQGLYFMLSTGMELTDNTKAYPLITLAGLITVVGAAIVLIWQWGAYGAALATMAGWLVMASVAYVLAQRQFRIVYDWSMIVKTIVVALLLATGSAVVQGGALPTRLAIACLATIVYPLCVYFFFRMSDAESERMEILWKRIRSRLRFHSASAQPPGAN